MKLLADCRLYAFVDTAYLRGRDPVQVTQQLCAGGADLIQLRAKELAPVEVQAIARRMRPVTLDAGYRRVDTLRAPFPELRIGLSSHAPAQAQRAIVAGADYLAIGPVYATGTKPSARPTALEFVRWAAANVRLPWFAIGGINLHTLDDVLAAGATRVCVVSAILDAADVAATCREFRQRLPA